MNMVMKAFFNSLLTLWIAVWCRSASGFQVRLDAALAQPVLRAGQKQTTFLKVGLTGSRMESARARAPVNVALVIDRSGSMAGEKLTKAKEAAMMALDRLGAQDIVSIVAFNQAVQVLAPATKLSEKGAVLTAIQKLEAGGSTALFAGVSRGSEEVRKFLDRSRVNRVILISDGIANVGPSSPAELGELGASLIKEGISVTTIGLGMDFNEDLLTQLGERSDGNHYFAERVTDLDRVFRNELGDVLSVVAQEVLVKIDCAEGVRPIRFLGRQGDITGRNATVYLNQIYSEQEKYVLLEIEVPAFPEGAAPTLASITVTYANMQTRSTDTLRSDLSARFASPEMVLKAPVNRDVMVAAAEQIATINSETAVHLRDMGKVEEARSVLLENMRYLSEIARKYNSDKLKDFAGKQGEDAKNVQEEQNWSRARKEMRAAQSSAKLQQKEK
jgi:Ca-activated chloride channel family protein